MSEPQDQRLGVPWNTTGKEIWTEPPVSGAPPLMVANLETTVEGLAGYLARVHNAHLRTADPLTDVGTAADAYLQNQWNGVEHGTEQIVRTAYVDGYGDGWRASTAVGEAQYRDLTGQVEAKDARLETMAGQLQRCQEDRNEIVAGWRAKQNEVEQVRADYQKALNELGALKKAHATLAERLADLEEAHRDLLDDARIAASLTTSPGAREAAAERIRRLSPTVQDQLQQFALDVQANPLGETPILPPNAQGGYPALPTDYPPNDAAGQAPAPDSYQKDRFIHGIGHHTPSFHEGYRLGHSDASQAYREPMDQRDQALYAAHLLLAESVAAREETRVPWQRAVGRWHKEYVAVFGSQEDQA
jgi:hypothetical protein